jgi:hypothetical protein
MANLNGPVDLSGLRCWVISEGHAGAENQCLGLAEALGCKAEIKRINVGAPWKWLSARWWLNPLNGRGFGGDKLAPPWPDLVISCARKPGGIAAAIRQASGGKTFAVHIQDPRLPPENFDLIAVPEHDKLRGENVIVTRGSLHRVTPARLAEAAEKFAPLLAHLPRPLLAVLIGGANRHFRYSDARIQELTAQLAATAKAFGAGLAVTPSRRTEAQHIAMLRAGLAITEHFFWEGQGENPYYGLLALADHIAVTSDSVSMLSEACATGKPVYVIEIAAGSPRWERFQRGLYTDGIARPFNGKLEHWNYTPLKETERVAAAIQKRLTGR